MKKLLALPALGAAAALTYGAAATLPISSSAAIQVGETNNVWCASSASVDGWGYEGDSGLVHRVRVVLQDGSDHDTMGACEGATLFVTVFDGGGSVIGQGKAENLGFQPGGNSPGYSVNLTPKPSASAIERVRLAIEG